MKKRPYRHNTYSSEEEKKAMQKAADNFGISVNDLINKAVLVLESKETMQEIVKNKRFPKQIRELYYEKLKIMDMRIK